MTINLYEHREDPGDRSWDLPMWGHPLSQGVLPLFIRVGDRLLPIGTAFWVGGGVPFILTALHNIAEALRHEPRYERLLASGQLPEKIDLRNAGLYVLHQDAVSETGGRLTLLPLETANGGPPGDVVFGFPRFQPGRATWAPPLSFDPPRIGETVWSIGYTDFEPAEGLSLEAIESGAFDWARSYKHRLVVTEGVVTRIFTQRFASGFTGGPCFAFDNEISHGQSGGPIISASGRVVGINSATATNFFDAPTSLGSMLYPLLLTPLQFGVDFGGGNFRIRLNGTRRLVDLVMQGVINTDGSEEHVVIHEMPEQGGYAVGPRIPKDDQPFTHADFDGYQNGQSGPIIGEGAYYRFVRTRPEENPEQGD